jgi:hypothetical protein
VRVVLSNILRSFLKDKLDGNFFFINITDQSQYLIELLASIDPTNSKEVRDNQRFFSKNLLNSQQNTQKLA